MSVDRLPSEGKAQFKPNPLETVPPRSAREAIEDSVRYLAISMPKSVVIENMQNLDVSRILQAAQDKTVKPPLTGFELIMADTVNYCIQEGLLEKPIAYALAEVSTLVASVKHGVVFGPFRWPHQ